jgi:hypothetical protein
MCAFVLGSLHFPTPLSPTAICGRSLELSAIDNVPVNLPAPVGENVTETVQLPPGPSGAEQLSVAEKGGAVAAEKIVTVTAFLPLAVRATVAVLVEPARTFPKLIDFGE